MPQSRVAKVEDYDSDESSVKPETVREARRSTQTKPPPVKIVQKRRDAPSDSGYSSHSSTVPAAQTVLASIAARQTAQASPTKGKSDQARPRAPSRSASVSGRQNLERRYTLPQQDAAAQYEDYVKQYQQQPAQAHPPQPQPPYQYPTAPVATPVSQVVPVMNPQPRPRATSTSRGARPASMYGTVDMSPYTARAPQPHGPPLSASAYHNQPGYFPTYQQFQQPYTYPAYGSTPPRYGSTPPTQTAIYMPPSPAQPSPTSPSYVATTTLARIYSARAPVADAAGAATTEHVAQPALTRTFSARHSAAIPGAFPEPDSSSEQSGSVSESETDSEYEREQREKEARRRARDSKLMPPPSRRPSIKKSHTTQSIPIPSSRQPFQRAPRSDTAVEYYSSSEHVDSDRTAHAVVDRPHRARTTSSYSSRSRRPSTSTTASSERTKATTMSGSSSQRKAVIFEDRRGRRKEYVSEEQYEELLRRQQQLNLEDREAKARKEAYKQAEAYQQHVNGPTQNELTAENIKKSQYRKSGSHVSGHSRKSSQSGSKARSDGIKIESGGTVLHVYGEANVEMRPDGGIIIGGGGGGSSRDSAYHGSKSSGSRLSKRKDTITEEYEPGL